LIFEPDVPFGWPTCSLASTSNAPEEPGEDRAASGVEGFDNLIEGGFPRGDLILLAGHPGSGKTMFSSQFLFTGATKYGEPGIYASFAEKQRSVSAKHAKNQYGFRVAGTKESLQIHRFRYCKGTSYRRCTRHHNG